MVQFGQLDVISLKWGTSNFKKTDLFMGQAKICGDFGSETFLLYSMALAESNLDQLDNLSYSRSITPLYIRTCCV